MSSLLWLPCVYVNFILYEDSEVGNIVHFMMKLVIGRLSKAAVPSAGAKELALLGAVTHLLTSGYLGQLLSDSSCSQLLLALVSLPPHLLLAKGQWWKPLLNFSLFSPQLQSQVNRLDLKFYFLEQYTVRYFNALNTVSLLGLN